MARKKTRRPARQDAVRMLMADHAKVKKLFKAFDKMKDGAERRKTELVGQICDELIVHTTLEEEIFYPALRQALDEEDMMDEADVEHDGAKSLIGQLTKMRPGEDHYDAKVTVLGEYIDHHVKEEHEEMFPKAKRAKLDLRALGERMAERRRELQARS